MGNYLCQECQRIKKCQDDYFEDLDLYCNDLYIEMEIENLECESCKQNGYLQTLSTVLFARP